MSDKPESTPSGAEKRRSTRVLHAASITVKGTDALGRSFREATKTIMVNCYGCLYKGNRYPAPSSAIMMEVRHANPRRPPRVVPGRVIWVQRPQHYRPQYHVGIEFEVPGNVWDIALPPEDWFPCPEDEELVVPAASEENIANPNQFVLRAIVTETAESPEEAAGTVANAVATSPSIETFLPAARSRSSTPGERHDGLSSPSERGEDRSPAEVAEMVRMFTAEAVAEELVRLREFIDSELSNAVTKAVDRLVARITAFSAIMPDSEAALSGETDEGPERVADGASFPAGEVGVGGETEKALEEPDAALKDAADGNGNGRLNARQRRAAKRSQKKQKAQPDL